MVVFVNAHFDAILHKQHVFHFISFLIAYMAPSTIFSCFFVRLRKNQSTANRKTKRNTKRENVKRNTRDDLKTKTHLTETNWKSF